MDEVTASQSDHPEILAFWETARFHAKLNVAPSYFGPTTLEVVPPPAWTYGVEAEEADAFAAELVAAEAGETRAPAADYDELPQPGTLSILCGGAGRPEALLELTEVRREGQDVVERYRVVYARD